MATGGWSIHETNREEESNRKEIDLSDQCLERLPVEVCENSHQVTALVLSGNWNIELARDLSKLQKLRRLNLSDCYLSAIPVELNDIKKLEELYIAQNKELKSLDPSLSHLTQLKKLDISQCSLTSIPDWFGNLQALEELNIAQNKDLRFLNSQLSQLSQLKKLDVSTCALTTFPDWLGELRSLEDLRLHQNELKRLDQTLTRLCQLKKLDISQCSLTDIPDWLGDIKTLTELNLNGNSGLKTLNKSLACLRQLTILNVSYCSLDFTPDWLGNLEELEELILMGNADLKSLDRALVRLSRLKKLDISFCSFTSLPDWLGEIQTLEELLLFGNEELPSLNSTLAKLTRLRKLDVQRCSLTSIPDWLGDFHMLEELLLYGNKKLGTINPVISRLSQLRKLNISQCSLSGVPEFLGDLQMLEELLFWRNEDIRSLHPTMSRLSRLQTKLCMSYCSVSSLPDWLGDLKLLKVLHVGWNGVQSLDPKLAGLCSLTMLDISHGSLVSIPDCLGELRMLEELLLQGNKNLQGLNPLLARLPRLKKLDISKCSLSSIPDYLGDCPMLTKLLMTDNKLKEYPDCTLRLKRIRSIDLCNALPCHPANAFGHTTPEGNSIKVLPTALAYTNLRELNLKGNPLTEPPEDIWKQGINSVKSYIRDIDQGKALMCADTINMLGDHDAGKTSTAQSLIRGSPDPAADSHRTRVMQKLLFKIDEKAGLSVNINDFGGHDIYHSVIPIFLPSDGLPIIVYDMLSEPQRQERSIRNWLITVLAKSSNTRIVIAGTRAEELSSEEQTKSVEYAKSLSAKILEQAVEEIQAHKIYLNEEVTSHSKCAKCEGQTYTNPPACALRADTSKRNLEKICEIHRRLSKVKIDVVALSCTAPHQGLMELRNLVTGILRCPKILPIQWCRVINDICSAKPDCLYLTWEDVTAIAKCHLTDDSSNDSLRAILSHLATTAQIFWIQAHDKLRHFIFHCPNSIIEVCKKVLDHDQALQHATEWAKVYDSSIEQYKMGYLNELFLMRLLSVDKSTSEVIIDFLLQFNLISVIASESHELTFVIPSNLPTNAPPMFEFIERKAVNNVNTVTLLFSFASSLIPMAFFETSIVSMLNIVHSLRKEGLVTYVWQDGIIIMHNNVHFIAARSGGTITLTASSARNEANMWSILHPVLRGLNENVSTLWNGIPPNCVILCPACKWRSQKAYGNSKIGYIYTNLQWLAAEATDKSDKVTCWECSNACPRCLCYPTHYGPFTPKQQNEIDVFFKKLGTVEQGPFSQLANNFTFARPYLIAELDKNSVEHIVDQLIAEHLVTAKQWQLRKAEQTHHSKARLLHDIVSGLGVQAIHVVLKALVLPNVDRPDLAQFIKKPSGL